MACFFFLPWRGIHYCPAGVGVFGVVRGAGMR